MNESICTGLLTDLYQLTMGAGYFHHGMAERESVFHLTFRQAPFGGAYAVAGGLADAVDLLNSFNYSEEAVAYLGTLPGRDGKPLFSREYLQYLRGLTFECDVDAIPEGTVVFPHEPLVRVQGPLLQAQLVETALLTLVNFQTLLATKASRVCRAAGGSVLEFGLRRAQGIDGGLTASRAAYLGGVSATSNVEAGRRYGIPVRGTHAHSWVMAFDGELESFRAYAEAMPNNTLLLVDTYDTLLGVDRAIEVAHQLKSQGHDLIGIRLDSGDIAALSLAARGKLDEAGFRDAVVVASSDLDEYEIARLKEAGARIDVWGVGTRLVTCAGQPALGGVYKLAAIMDAAGQWQYRLKLSSDAVKVSTPGIQTVRRYRRNAVPVADVIVDEGASPQGAACTMEAFGDGSSWQFTPDDEFEVLLRPVLRGGSLVAALPTLDESRERCLRGLSEMPDGVLEHEGAKPFPVGLESGLLKTKLRLIEEARRESP